MLGLLFLFACFHLQKPLIEPLHTTQNGAIEQGPQETLSVMTLNLAHGRALSRSQIGLPPKQFRHNLQDIAEFFDTQSPDIIALQEADGPSYWSGQFDHIHFLANEANLSTTIRGSHSYTRKLDYGTAILSNRDISPVASVQFEHYRPFPPKGFVHASFQTEQEQTIHVISVHIDPLRESIRRKQLQTLIASLESEEGFFVIMGDFNMEWSSTLSELCKELSIKAYQPEETTVTFPKSQKRLDWILISEELDFADYTVHTQPLSDHYAVSAEIILPKSAFTEP